MPAAALAARSIQSKQKQLSHIILRDRRMRAVLGVVRQDEGHKVKVPGLSACGSLVLTLEFSREVSLLSLVTSITLQLV